MMDESGKSYLCIQTQPSHRFKWIRSLILATVLLTVSGPRFYLGIPRAAAFDLSQCTVPTDTLKSGGPTKDGIPSLTEPRRYSSRRAKYLAPSDRVIGVMIGSETVAYPIRILNYHECINDVVGGRSIAVTYCPLCDSAFVFNREIDGAVLEFGISGLLLNSNVLLYDRQRRTKDESLWSQVAMRAVCGPAAANQKELELIPSEMVTWSDWTVRHPESEVLSQVTRHARDYEKSPYDDYFLDDELMFPISEIFETPINEPQIYLNKEPAIVVKADTRTRVYPFSELLAVSDANGIVQDQIGSQPVSFVLDREAKTVRLKTNSDSLSAAYTFWFAWRSLQKDYDVFRAK